MTKTQKPNKGGRPRVDSEAVSIRIQREMLTALDNYRREQDDLPTRPEAIRRILQDWMIGHRYLPFEEDPE